ncbi:hypothetical protein F5X99DRAFT_55051 [Biscogniauxia marginata]|nr:hypothetical protein F5X99DRAFT_55051 [Biscogniauxia marginata]
MAANMPQMGAGAAMRNRPQHQQLSHIVFNHIMANPVQSTGWQVQVPNNLRVSNTMNLISNSFLAMPQIDSQQLMQHGLTFEREAFINSNDKNAYDQRIGGRVQELFKRRQANEQNIHHTLNAQAAAQAQAQAAAQAQAQMMMNQNMQMGRGMGQPPQQGFQHLQQQMQPSPIPQQPQQPGMGMGNPGGVSLNPNHQGMQMGGQMRPQVPMQTTLANLSPQDRAKVTQLAVAKLNQTPEANRAQLRMMLQQKLSPQQMAQLRQENMDPLLFFFQNQILQASKGQVGPNPAAMQMQAGQTRQMNQSGQQVGGGSNGPFSNVEIMSQQKAGLLAQEQGQMVVPASSGPGRNATPQPMGGVHGPNGGNNHPGPNQPAMSHQMPQQFNHPQQFTMDQKAAQSQAQIRAQAHAKQMQGQPGGLNGAGAVSQSPAMNTLNTPVRRTPMGIGQPEGQPQMGQGNAPFNQVLDPRFNQANQRPQMGANLNVNRQQLIQTMLQQMPPESRQQFMALPPDKINELLVKWTANQAARAAGQMPGRPQPQPGQFGQGNPMAQFAPGNNNGQQPTQGMGISQQNMLMQQQINRAQHNIPGQNRPQMPPNANALMDSMDVPPKIMEQLRSNQLSGLPVEIKKWSQLKGWLAQKKANPQLITQLLSVQNVQFTNILRRNQNMPAMGQQIPQPNGPQQAAQPQAGQMAAQPTQPAQPTANMGVPPAGITITPQEIQQARNHEQFKNWPEENIRTMLMTMKANRLKGRVNGQMPNGQMQGVQTSQPPSINASAPAQQMTGSNAPQRQQNAGSDGNTTGTAVPARNKQPPVQNNRPPQNTSSAPAQQKNSLKRPNTDDASDAQNASNVPVQRRPQSQQPQAGTSGPQFPQLTPQQLANMSHEQRQKYEAMRARQSGAAGLTQANLPSDLMQRLKNIGQEEHHAASQEQLKDIPMSPEHYQDMAQKIQSMVQEMTKLSKVLGRWYTLTQDDVRARMFFRMRLRLIKQFVDGDKMTTLKNLFSVTPKDLEGVRGMLESMAKDVASTWPQGMRKNVSQQNAPDNAPQQGTAVHTTTPPTTQPAPLNAANLEKQTQALNKMHQRTSSKSGQPPAAPTTSQPPFPFGAQSPNGQPTYASKPAITQDNLHLPARKKVKTGVQSGVGSGSTSANASPQVQKLPSPEMTKRPAPAEAKASTPKPLFQCPELNCDFHNTGFATEEAQRAHIDEEHVKPAQDPHKYVRESLAEALGLDSNGNPKASPAGNTQLVASPMTSDTSKQGHAPTVKAEATPMSRDPSMRRQGSAAGSKPNELIKTVAGKAGTPKAEPTTKSTDIVTGAARTERAAVSQPTGVDNVFTMATVDPQDLFQNFPVLDTGGNGAISDMNAYRSITPNDTPESIKDSASSEPNSDVSEGVALNVTLDMGFDSWRPFEGNQFMMGPDSMDMGMGDLIDLDSMGDNGFPEFTCWDDVNPDFGKPFSLDTSLYSLDTT